MSLYRQFRLVAFAAAFGVVAHAQAQVPGQSPQVPKTTDSTTPADAASGETTSMGRGDGSTSSDQGVTNLGAEATRDRTASGSVVLPNDVRASINACARLPVEAQHRSAACHDLAGRYPAEFNADATARHLARPQ